MAFRGFCIWTLHIYTVNIEEYDQITNKKSTNFILFYFFALILWKICRIVSNGLWIYKTLIFFLWPDFFVGLHMSEIIQLNS